MGIGEGSSGFGFGFRTSGFRVSVSNSASQGFRFRIGGRGTVSGWMTRESVRPCTPNPAPCPAPCILHPAPCTLNPEPRTVNPEPCTLNPNYRVRLDDARVGAAEPRALVRTYRGCCHLLWGVLSSQSLVLERGDTCFLSHTHAFSPSLALPLALSGGRAASTSSVMRHHRGCCHLLRGLGFEVPRP